VSPVCKIFRLPMSWRLPYLFRTVPKRNDFFAPQNQNQSSPFISSTAIKRSPVFPHAFSGNPGGIRTGPQLKHSGVTVFEVASVHRQTPFSKETRAHSSQRTCSGRDTAMEHIWPLTVRHACLISKGASLTSMSVRFGIRRASSTGSATQRVHA
jgi:hypothetical protein